MKRQTYIYWAVPLFTLLGCGASFEAAFGATGTLVVGSLIALLTWGLVWMRLYTGGRMRPECAVLSILPQLLFFVLIALGETGENAAFAAPAWQNLYFLLFVASVIVQILSLRPGQADESRTTSQDPVFIILTVLILANGFFSWAHYAARLFPIS